MRALLDASGTTLLEATTGALDSAATAPGTITTLQVKAFSRAEKLISTHMSTDLSGGGALQQSFASFSRGQSLQVQANVQDQDGERTDVVTVTTPVKLRPDLAVSRLVLPAEGRVNIPVEIEAVVSELNRDVGAWGDCVLSVNGAEVDRARGIWVDAAGGVSCAFTHAFWEPGHFEVTVAVEGVTPGDFDVGNNSRTESIQVSADAVSPFTYWAAASDSTLHEEWYSPYWYSWYGSDMTRAPDGWYVYTQETHSQNAYLSGYSLTRLTFPVARVTLRHATAGQDILLEELHDVPATWSDGGYVCANHYDDASGSFLLLCSYPESEFPYSWLTTHRYAGEVIYYGRGYSRWHDGPLVEYQDSWSYGGKRVPFGNDYTFEASVEDDAGRFAASLTLPLTARSDAGQGETTCMDYPLEGGTLRECTQHSWSSAGLFGEASGVIEAN